MFPVVADEVTLHQRVLSGEPLASLDVFTQYVQPLRGVVQRDLKCDDDIAYDSAIDACFAYLNAPDRYDRGLGRLCTYLIKIAQNKAVDRLRSASRRSARDEAFSNCVELGQANPMEKLMDSVQAGELLEHVEASVTDARDRGALRLILQGESETAKLAEALGLEALHGEELRRQVKRERDRLMKTLERVGKKLADD